MPSNLHIRFILDLSGSMNYAENGFSRLAYAKNLLASLAYLGYLQGDGLSYYTLSEGKIEQKVSPTPKSFQRILFYLEAEKASGSWPLEAFPDSLSQGRDRELIIWVSDFLQKETEWENLVANFRHPRKELMLIQLLGEQELDLKLEGNFVFRDLESGEEFVQDGRSVQAEFNRKFKAYLDQLSQSFQLPKVQLLRISMKTPLSEVVRSILNRKNLA